MKKNGIVIALTFVLALAVTSCGSGGPTANSPSKSVEKVFGYIMDKDYEKAAKMYASEDGKMLTEEEVAKITALLPMMVQEYNKKDGLKSIKVLQEKISENGDEAKVDITMKYGNGEEKKESLKVMKIDGNWYLSPRM